MNLAYTLVSQGQIWRREKMLDLNLSFTALTIVILLLQLVA